MDGSILVPLPRFFFSTKTSNRVVFDPYSISELKPTEPRRHSDDRARTPIKGTRSPPVVIYFDSFCRRALEPVVRARALGARSGRSGPRAHWLGER